MASLHLDFPEQFDFCSSDDWPRCNKIFERARFNKRDQLCGELAEQYITVRKVRIWRLNIRDDLMPASSQHK